VSGGSGVTVVEDRPIMSVKYRLPVIFGQNCPMESVACDS